MKEDKVPHELTRIKMLLGPCARDWHIYTHQELKLFRSLVTRIEREINNSIQAIQENIEPFEFEVGSPGPFVVRHIDGLDDVNWDLEDVLQTHFPNIQRSAYVITLFSFLESSLIELCEFFHTEKSLNVQYSESSGKGITRCKNYLSKVVGLDFTKINREWESINNLKKVRNAIVHRNRLVPQEDASTLRFIHNHQHLDLNQSEIIVKEGFLLSMLISTEQFVTAINSLVVQVHDSEPISTKLP